MDIETMHRPVWQAVSSGGSKTNAMAVDSRVGPQVTS